MRKIPCYCLPDQQNIIDSLIQNGDRVIGFGLILPDDDNDIDFLTGGDLVLCSQIIIPYEEIRAIKQLDTKTSELATWAIDAETTEGRRWVMFISLSFVGDITEWIRPQ